MKFNLLQGFYPTFCRLSQEFHLINNISHQLFLATLPYSTTRGIVLALRAVHSPIPCLTGQKGISSLCSDIPSALAGRALAQDCSFFRKRKENCFFARLQPGDCARPAGCAFPYALAGRALAQDCSFSPSGEACCFMLPLKQAWRGIKTTTACRNAASCYPVR